MGLRLEFSRKTILSSNEIDLLEVTIDTNSHITKICPKVSRQLIPHSHQKLSCLKSGAEFDMNDILYEFKNLHHFKDSLTFGVNAA